MRDRFITAAIAGPIALACIFCSNPWPLGILLSAIVVVGFEEIRGLLKRPAYHWASAIGLFWSIYPAALHLGGRLSSFDLLVGSASSLAVGAALLAFGLLRRQTVLAMFGGPLYVAAPLAVFLALHQALAPPESRGVLWFANPVLLPVLSIWAGDIAAILVGKVFGRHPMAASISPNKTWEGAIANAVFATLAGALTARWLGFSPLVGTLVGLVCGTLGQAGDLYESWLKRKAGAKDSGALLPGHGGVLDRLDSLLFALIPACAILIASQAGLIR